MLKTSFRTLLELPSIRLSITKLESGIPSLNEIKKLEDDYHPSEYTILGNKRKDAMHYTNRKVGGGYWRFSNTIFHSRPKIHPKIAKELKRNFYIIFAVLIGLCIDYGWIGCQIKKFSANFGPEAAN